MGFTSLVSCILYICFNSVLVSCMFYGFIRVMCDFRWSEFHIIFQLFSLCKYFDIRLFVSRGWFEFILDCFDIDPFVILVKLLGIFCYHSSFSVSL